MSERTESFPAIIQQLQLQFKGYTPAQLHAAAKVPLVQCRHLLTGDPSKLSLSSFIILARHAGFVISGYSFEPMSYHDKAIEHQEWDGVRGASKPSE